jgi:uncharacterized membrane protein YfcA
MLALVVGVCLAGAGTIVSVFSYFYDLEVNAEKAFQIIGLGMVGVGATLGSWSVLHKAGEQDLFLPIILWFAVVIGLTYCFARRNRRITTPVDANKGTGHKATDNGAISTHSKRPGNTS